MVSWLRQQQRRICNPVYESAILSDTSKSRQRINGGASDFQSEIDSVQSRMSAHKNAHVTQ